MARAEARFFDGEIAAEHAVSVTLAAGVLTFGGPAVRQRSWPVAGVRVVSGGGSRLPLRLTHELEPGARLIIADEAVVRELTALAPHVGGAVNYRRMGKAAAIIALALVAAGLLLYVVLTLAPRQFAFMMPDSWREQLGDQIERSFTADAQECLTSGGLSGLTRLESRLREGNPDLPEFVIAVYDMPIVNAFTLPGGRIVVTGKLIEAATAPDQVAGVIAHELGHVAHRDPEAQLFRAAGLQVLLALFTGGMGSDTLGGLAGTLAILRYSRDAERDADRFAVEMMTKAEIDPMGLKHFFEAMREQEGKDPGGPFGKLTGMLATHPLTEDRINAIKPLPPGVAREVLPAEDWAELKRICAGSS
jgi:Zn-dependent protease with chaperone function